MRVSTLVSFVAILVAHPTVRGFELVPLDVEAISVQAAGAVIRSGFNDTPTGAETTTASSLTFTFNEPNQTGSLSSSVTVVGNTINVSSTLTLSGVGPVFGIFTDPKVTLRLEVPFVGGAFTPVIVVTEDSAVSIVGEINEESFSVSPEFVGGFFSTSIGASYQSSMVAAQDGTRFSGTGPQHAVYPLVAGDTVEFTFRIQHQVGSSGSAPYEVTRTGTVRLYTVGQAPGTGDLNADGITDLLDSVLLRRTLAGVPVN